MIRHLHLLAALAVFTACGGHPPNVVVEDGGAQQGGGAGGGAGGGSGDLDAGETDGGEDAGSTNTSADGGSLGDGGIPYVFVIAMENKNDDGVYGNAAAPYINDTLMAQYAYASNYTDCLTTAIPSEPHYVWLEAATNSFSDWTFYLDSDPGSFNSTTSTQHLATQLKTANNGKDWRSYQEGLDAATTGACPVSSSGFYAAKHDPFIFFTDVAGDPPSKTNVYCAAHHRAYTPAGFQSDLNSGDVAAYTFITPNLCNDMHGDSSCTNGCTSGTAAACVSAGDAWLQANVPPIISFINQHGGVLFIVWDEPENTTTQPFLVIGPHVKPGHGSTVNYTHSSYVKSLDQILRLPVLQKAQSANDFSDFFEAGHYP